MRAVHASAAAAKHNVAAVTQSASQSAQTGDAFSALVQSLADAGAASAKSQNDANTQDKPSDAKQDAPAAAGTAAPQPEDTKADSKKRADADDSDTGGDASATDSATASSADGADPTTALAALGLLTAPQTPPAPPPAGESALSALAGNAATAPALPDAGAADPAKTQDAAIADNSADADAGGTQAATDTALPAGLFDAAKTAALTHARDVGKAGKAASDKKNAGASSASNTDQNAKISASGLPATAHGIGASAPKEGLPSQTSHASGPSAVATHAAAPASDGATSGATADDTNAAASATPDPAAAQANAANPDPINPGLAIDSANPALFATTATVTSAAQPATDASASLTLLPRAAALAASAVAQVNVILQRAGLSQADTLTVQLDPAELGRVEVKLRMERDGPVHARITADSPSTLDMLRNDKTSLERALQNAGLNTDGGSLSFNLRDNGNSASQNGFGQFHRGGSGKGSDPSSTSVQTLDVVPAAGGWTNSGRFDLRV